MKTIKIKTIINNHSTEEDIQKDALNYVDIIDENIELVNSKDYITKLYYVPKTIKTIK